MFNLITNITCYNILICVFVGSRNEDAKRSHARRVINNPPSMLPVTANNEEPVEIEIFGTVPRPLLSNAREVTGDVEESMEEDELENDVEFARKMPSKVPPMVNNPPTENANVYQNNIAPDSTTKRVLPIDNTAERDVPVDLSIEENITDEEDGSRIQEEPHPPTPPTEAESDTSTVAYETSKPTEGENRKNTHDGEKKKIAEEAETVPMDEEAETQSMNEETETEPMASQSVSGRNVEPNTLLIVDVVGNTQESSSMVSDGNLNLIFA